MSQPEGSSAPQQPHKTESSLADTLTKSPHRLIVLGVGLVAVGMTWASVHAGAFADMSVSGWETDSGKLYLLILGIILVSEYRSNTEHIKKAWFWGGIALVAVTAIQYFHTQSVFREAEAEAAAEGFGGMVQTDIGFGLYIAVLAGLTAAYVGYSLVPENTTPALQTLTDSSSHTLETPPPEHGHPSADGGQAHPEPHTQQEEPPQEATGPSMESQSESQGSQSENLHDNDSEERDVRD